ncbi:MBL fold metallo-hydrolase [uncultured Sphingomonas sp.]|uniref:MBL fold metallo-hydrolase n=1 Tax=uncultured Sphingomonas sp. TaxID=158754 RepID=UPI0035CC07D7
MRITILGSGTSSGVPRVGNDWGACNSRDARNRRRRASALVETATTRILIDTGPDLREQLLDAGVDRVDAVIWTHAHADHVHGIDDLRQLYHAMGGPVRCLARAPTLGALIHRFDYAFAGRGPYPPIITGEILPDRLVIGDIAIGVVDQPHAEINSAGLRFDGEDGAIGYATDFNVMTDGMRGLYRGLDLLVVDCLRREPHPSHPTLAQALGWIADLAPGRAALTHLDQSMDYAALLAELPANVVPAHDGLRMTARQR